MRLATLIIGLVLTFGLFIQSLLVSAGGAIIEDKGTEESGAMGVFVALLFLIASALVMAFPRVAGALFGVGGLLAFAGSGDFPDLVFWGIVGLALAVMAYFGYREKRKKRAEVAAAAPQV